jgi:hypothetical protein
MASLSLPVKVWGLSAAKAAGEARAAPNSKVARENADFDRIDLIGLALLNLNLLGLVLVGQV